MAVLANLFDTTDHWRNYSWSRGSNYWTRKQWLMELCWLLGILLKMFLVMFSVSRCWRWRTFGWTWDANV